MKAYIPEVYVWYILEGFTPVLEDVVEAMQGRTWWIQYTFHGFGPGVEYWQINTVWSDDGGVTLHVENFYHTIP